MTRLLLFVLLLLPSLLSGQENKKVKVFRFAIREEIAPPAVRTTTKAIRQAHELGADYIFLDLNTYGGLVDAADSIRSRILSSSIPVVVLIENNAASAGALISIACDSIYMYPGSTIGAATVVDQSGQQVPDKYQSYMRKKMRATAEMTGRDPDMAEAMVDPDVRIPNVIDSGKVLTLTVTEAIRYGFCEGEAASLKAVMKEMGIADYQVTDYQPTFIDKVIGLLINPFVSGILIMIMIGGIYFELQTPGIGFPIIAALTAAILYFAPHYLEGLAQHWEILLFIGGVVLVGLELFVIPGFGIAGISGIALMVIALTLSLVGNVGFDFPVGSGDKLIQSFVLVILSSVIAIGISIYLGARLIHSEIFRKVILSTDLPMGNASAQDFGNGIAPGTAGTAATDLRPSGKVIVNGEWYEATALTGYIMEGEPVEVVRTELRTVIVKRSSGNKGL